jgi:hypothetical protein
VTGPSGETAIAYHARMELAGLSATYVSLLLATPDGLRQRARLGRHRAPERSGDEVRWESAALEVSLLSRALGPAVEEKLLDGPEGSLVWSCRQPLARVELSGAATISGHGYVEELDLTVPPWSLPIDTLRWGRFASEAGVGLVWIEWRGEDPRALAFRVTGGRCERVEARAIGDEEVLLSSGRLKMSSMSDRSDRVVLRRDALGGLLPEGPLAARLRRALPSRLLQARETKWRSRAVYREADRAVAGWAIHETVVLR